MFKAFFTIESFEAKMFYLFELNTNQWFQQFTDFWGKKNHFLSLSWLNNSAVSAILNWNFTLKQECVFGGISFSFNWIKSLSFLSFFRKTDFWGKKNVSAFCFSWLLLNKSVVSLFGKLPWIFVNRFDCKSSVFCFKLVQFHIKKEIFGLLVGF